MSEETKLRILTTRLVDQVSHLCMVVSKLQADLAHLMGENDSLKVDVKKLKHDLSFCCTSTTATNTAAATLLTRSTLSLPVGAIVEEVILDSTMPLPTPPFYRHSLQTPLPTFTASPIITVDPLNVLSTPPEEDLIRKDLDLDFENGADYGKAASSASTSSYSSASDYFMTDVDVFECLESPIIEFEAAAAANPNPNHRIIQLPYPPLNSPIQLESIDPLMPSIEQTFSDDSNTPDSTITTNTIIDYYPVTMNSTNIIPGFNHKRSVRRVNGSLKVLVVEDDPLCQQLICHIVKSFGIGQVEVVSDGVEAVINMTTSSFDLILMDMHLPRLDGLQATQNIRKFNRRTPIVSMTSRVSSDDLKRYYAGGIDDVLPKPFDKNSVQRIIQQFFKLSLNEKDNNEPVVCTCCQKS